MSKTELIFDEIWSIVEEKFNKVPPYIKYILSYCGYDNVTSIATIVDDDIKHFVSEVRNGNVTNYFKEINHETNVLEGSTKKIEEFEFRPGHLKHLMSIVKFLKKQCEENGPDFTNTKQKKKCKCNKPQQNMSSVPRKRIQYSEALTVVASGMENDMEIHKNILMQKMQCSLTNHTSKLYAENSCKIKERMSSGQLIIVQAGESQDRKPESETIENSKGSTKVPKYTASMICPYCLTNITVFYVSDAPRWNSSNFDRHLKLSHCPQPVNKENEVEEKQEESGDKSDAEIPNVPTANAETKTAETGIEKISDAATIPAPEDDKKPAKIDPINVTYIIDTDSDENCPTSAPLSQFGVKSKNIVCYSDSDDSDVDGETEEQDQLRSYAACPNANLEPKRSQILLSKANGINSENDELCYIRLIENNTGNSCPFSIIEDLTNDSQRNDANNVVTVSPAETLTGTQDHKYSTNNPTKGDYVICWSNDSSIKWPATVPPVKYFLAHVLQGNDTSDEFEVDVLKKSPYSKSAFGFPEKNDIRFVSSKEIIKILEIPPRHLRNSLVFKEKSLLEYNFTL